MVRKILYINNEKEIEYGAHFINSLIVKKLRTNGYMVDSMYPKESINLFSKSLSGISDILFYYSLIRKRKQINKYDVIQGTTYTPLAFLDNGVPVVSLFGSTTHGFLKHVPSLKKLDRESRYLVKIFNGLKKYNVVDSLVPSIKSLKDISKIEIFVAKKSAVVISTSEIVKRELIRNGIPKKKITLVHNAIEDFWFKTKKARKVKPIAELVYLGRMGDDPFTVKLKGIDRLGYILKAFPGLRKTVIGMCSRVDEYHLVFSQFPEAITHLSVKKKKIPKILQKHYGDIYINPGRYEGFCLSLIEAMSQGLVPITFPTGVAPEIIQHGRNGYLVNKITEMVKTINHLMRKKALRTRMAKEAVRTSRHFKADKIIKQYINVYQTLENKESLRKN
ncbi:MAG: glycosyltransferase family 4 protein [candidate division WOR-3 bacterium]|nr:MAG: glycosyltransferase family 4 protein [candidate division WOR-3 bacterium]